MRITQQIASAAHALAGAGCDAGAQAAGETTGRRRRRGGAGSAFLRAVADFGRPEREEADGTVGRWHQAAPQVLGVNIQEPIEVAYETSDEELLRAIANWELYIRGRDPGRYFRSRDSRGRRKWIYAEPGCG